MTNATNALYLIMQKFGQGVGMESFFAHSFEFKLEAILVIAFLSCFFGFKIVRLWSAVISFFLTAIAICEMLGSTTHMGVIVITFTMIGLITAFIVYHWYKLSLFILSTILGYSIVAVLTPNIWVCFAAAILFGVLSIFFSPHIVIVTTAVWGGIILGFEGMSYMEMILPNIIFTMTEYKIAGATGLTAIGLVVQYFMNKPNLIPTKKQSFQTSVTVKTFSTER